MLLINIIAFDGCEIIDKSLNENDYFPKLKINNERDIYEFYQNAKTCKTELGGNGDFIKKYDIDKFI